VRCIGIGWGPRGGPFPELSYVGGELKTRAYCFWQRPAGALSKDRARALVCLSSAIVPAKAAEGRPTPYCQVNPAAALLGADGVVALQQMISGGGRGGGGGGGGGGGHQYPRYKMANAGRPAIVKAKDLEVLAADLLINA
jgi:hypothetical protein